MTSKAGLNRLEKVLNFTNGRTSPERDDNSGIPVYGSNGLIGQASEANSPANTIVIGRVGSYCGSVHFSKKPCWVTDNAIKATAKVGNNPYFLFYLLKYLNLNNWRSGSGQPLLNQATLNAIQASIPPESAQYLISDFLCSIDDRITLLQESNLTLEAIAQALFKSWFVDFDPVRAKQEGRQPEGMDAETAALFPDSFEQSELGEIPKGWGIGNLGDIFTLRNDRIKASTQTLLLPYVPIESIESKTLFLKKFKSGDEANSSLVLFKEGDILFGAMRPYFHKVCIAPFNGVTRTTVFTLAPIDFKATAFALFQAFQEQTVSYATKNSEGSTIPYAKWKNSLEKMAIVVPKQNLQRKFSEIVMPLINSGNENSSRSRTLACLHDTLLPRLISGQLRLPDVEEQIEAVLA